TPRKPWPEGPSRRSGPVDPSGGRPDGRDVHLRRPGGMSAVVRDRGAVTPFLLPPSPLSSLDEYLATQTGGLGLQRAQEIGPAATIAEVTRAGLRGRGGAGFPTGRKWSGVVEQPGTRRYVVANAAEGEPGTFKDRALLRANPYQFVEGLIIAAFVVDAEQAFFALKESFEEERERVTRAIVEMQDAGICRDCELVVVAGPEEYLYGEEK